MPQLDDEIPTREAADILGYLNVSSIARMVYAGQLLPSRKLPGKNGAYLFRRSTVVALAKARKAELSAAADRIPA